MLPIPLPSMDETTLSQALALITSGLSCKEVSRQLRIPNPTLARWLVRVRDLDGDIEAALASAAPGRPVVFEPNDLETAIARWHRLSKESLTVAAWFFARDARVRPALAAVILAIEEKALASGRDEAWPDSVRRAFRVTAQERADFRGKKHAQHEEMVTRRGMYEILEDGSHREILPGETWELDDYSANQPYTFKDPQAGGLMLGRQVLAARDLSAARWLGFDHIGRERDAYRGEDIVRYIERLCRAWGLPRRLRLERGAWEGEAVHGIEVEGMATRWGALDDLFAIEHVFKSKSKGIIESGFDVLQRWLAHTGSDIGRVRGEFEEATKRLRQAQSTGACPLALGFVPQERSSRLHEEAAALINSRPMRRAHLDAKISPDDLVARHGWHTRPFAEDIAWYFLPYKIQRTVRAGTVEVTPGNGWQKLIFALNGIRDGVHFENGHQVLLAFDPARPDLGARVCNGDRSARNRQAWRLGQCLIPAAPVLDLAPQFNASSILSPHMAVRKKASAAASTTFRAIRAAAGTHQPAATREAVAIDGSGGRASSGNIARQDARSRPAADAPHFDRASSTDHGQPTTDNSPIPAPIRSVHVTAPAPTAWSSRAVPATREGRAAEIERLKSLYESAT